MAKQNQQVVSKLIKWREKLQFYHTELKEKVVPLKFYYNPDTDILILEYLLGTGASERQDKIIFKESVLDEKLKLFVDWELYKQAKAYKSPISEEQKAEEYKLFGITPRVTAKEGVIDNRNEVLKLEGKPPIQKNYKNTRFKLNLQMAEKSEQNLNGLRNHLFAAIEKLENNEMDVEKAKATAQLSQTIINSVKLEMEYKKLLTKNPQVKFLD